jgi:hypothetical protein
MSTFTYWLLTILAMLMISFGLALMVFGIVRMVAEATP